MAIEAYKLTVGALHFGAWVQNDMHFLADNDDDSTTRAMAFDLVDAWNFVCSTPWLGTLPESYAIQWIQAQRVIPSGGDAWWKEFPGSTANGTLGTGAATLNTAPIVKLYPGMGVHTQGRVFMPGIAETMLIGNVYDSDYVDAVNDWIAVQLSFDNGGKTWTWGIRSPRLNLCTPVIAAALGPIIGNIGRRRIPR